MKTNQVSTNPVQFQFYAGQGIATYVVSFSGLNYDAAADGQGNVKAIPTFGGWGAYEHFFTPKWHINLVGGFSVFDSHEFASFTITGPDYEATDTSVNLQHYYGLFNVMWTPEPALTFGIEYNYGKKRNKYDGAIDTGDEVVASIEQSRDAHRISFGLFFDF